MEEQILSYQAEQQQQLQQAQTVVEICAGASETFFEQVVLVLLDLPSGYVFVESHASDRQYRNLARESAAVPWSRLWRGRLGKA